MNLIEARKQAHEGWVRSPTRMDGEWVRLGDHCWEPTEHHNYHRNILTVDLDAADWEPKPKPVKPWEGSLWISVKSDTVYEGRPSENDAGWIANGWRKIRAREVEG